MMSKIFIICFLMIVSLHATPRHLDLYFANGMMGKSEKEEKDTWQKYVKTLQYTNPNISENTSTAKVAYNASELWVQGQVTLTLYYATLQQSKLKESRCQDDQE